MTKATLGDQLVGVPCFALDPGKRPGGPSPRAAIKKKTELLRLAGHDYLSVMGTEKTVRSARFFEGFVTVTLCCRRSGSRLEASVDGPSLAPAAEIRERGDHGPNFRAPESSVSLGDRAPASQLGTRRVPAVRRWAHRTRHRTIAGRRRTYHELRWASSSARRERSGFGGRSREYVMRARRL